MIKSSWRSPSNIALVKYWGKMNGQLPLNASISMTLEKSYTETTLQLWTRNEIEKTGVEFFFEGQPVTNDFGNKIMTFLRKVQSEFSFLKNSFLRIDSYNSFPHSAGIASSASALSALSCCLGDLHNQLQPEKGEGFSLSQLSELARMGSGSACRSLFPGYVVWGMHPSVPGSSNEFAIPVNDRIHPVFKAWGDAILIIDPQKKKVSSSEGHELMNRHFYREGRIRQAAENMGLMMQALSSGNEELFLRVMENEALSLHGLMLSSDPSFVLLREGTLSVMRKIKNFRESEHIPAGFTLDAGPNIHLLYPLREREKVLDFVQSELVSICSDGRWIDDQTGSGPLSLKV